MVQNNTAVKIVGETLEEKLARLEAENAELQAKVASIPAPGEFKLGVTVQRDPGTRLKSDGTKDAADKGAKGGSISIKLGKQNVYMSKAMMLAIFEHEKECKAHLLNPAITR